MRRIYPVLSCPRFCFTASKRTKPQGHLVWPPNLRCSLAEKLPDIFWRWLSQDHVNWCPRDPVPHLVQKPKGIHFGPGRKDNCPRLGFFQRAVEASCCFRHPEAIFAYGSHLLGQVPLGTGPAKYDRPLGRPARGDLPCLPSRPQVLSSPLLSYLEVSHELCPSARSRGKSLRKTFTSSGSNWAP